MPHPLSGCQIKVEFKDFLLKYRLLQCKHWILPNFEPKDFPELTFTPCIHIFIWIYSIELFHSAAPDFVEKFAAGKTRVDVLSYTREEKWDQPELSCKNGHISHWKMAKLPLLVLTDCIRFMIFQGQFFLWYQTFFMIQNLFRFEGGGMLRFWNVLVLVLVLNFESIFCDLLASVSLVNKNGCKGKH